jgi:FixJ family two-component response regulator
MGKLKPFVVVVVVDDDESVSRAIMRLLRSIGIASETFASGDAFLDVLASIPSYQPDCVILDVQIPGLSELEVQQRLCGRSIPVIFITAHDDIDVREHALACGAVAYLRKPFNDEVFVRIVRAAIDGTPQNRSNRARSGTREIRRSGLRDVHSASTQ